MKITLKSTYRRAFRGFLTTILAFTFIFSANHLVASGGEEGGKFKAGEMIVHHISDAHSIHFFGPLTMPLPLYR
ncbi:MAG: hypothetical protein IPP69_01250 [Flavobacteriales bacterium]|nr:hypothetical protein [Flavobacteriales bacterium]